jgi:OsmC subfamily peroxiredoxin
MGRRVAGERRRVRLGAIYAAHGASHGFVLVFPAVLMTLRTEFGASFTTLGTVATVSSMLYGLGALPGGLLADRFGAPVLLRVFAGLSALCCALAAVASGIWWLAVALALLGAAGALYHPSGLAEVTLNAPGGGRELGVHGGFGNGGTALAPLVAGAVAAAWTWRASYGLAAVAALVLLVALVRDVPLDRRLPPQEQAASGAVGRGALVVVMFLAAAEGFVFQGFVTFLPAFLAEVGGAGPAAAAKGGVLAAAVLLLGVPGQLVGGRLAETDPRRLALRYAGLYGGAVLAGLSVRAAGATPLGVALAGLFSLLIFLGQPITNQLVARSTRAGRRGAAYGTYFSLSFGVGALAGVAGGVVADRSGLAAVFAFLGLVAVVNTLGGLAVRGLLGPRVDRAGPGGLAFRGLDDGSIGRDVDMAMADRQAHTLWEGPLIGGKGDTWAARTESPDGKTSPEELLAAAHATCYAMAFSHFLAQAGNPPERLHVTSTVSLDPKEGGGVVVTRSALEVNGTVPGYDQDGFQQAAEEAEKGCPISNAIRGNLEITVKATLDA